MIKRILITGATSGIGLETAKTLLPRGHQVLLHGRSESKLEEAKQKLSADSGGDSADTFAADLSRMFEVESLAKAITKSFDSLDVVINNAGLFVIGDDPMTADGIDKRFAVNTIAPYLLTKRLLPLLSHSGRVINLSSAAQAPVSIDALKGKRRLSDGEAYAQSKLALTMWSHSLAASLADDGPAIIAVNPGSMLGSKMVQQAYGVAGKDLGIGADILTRAAVDNEFASASGQYFDNDSGRFASPHPDARNDQKCEEIVRVIESLLPSNIGNS